MILLQDAELSAVLNQIKAGQSLSREVASKLMDAFTRDGTSPEFIKECLMALKAKKESVDEILGFTDSLRKKANAFPTHSSSFSSGGRMDVCGTGGDRSGSFNVSTTVAFVVASSGVPIAKHGNRSVSSRSGSFDVLESLGIETLKDPAKIASSIEDYGLGFLFAPVFHPVLAKLGPLRKELGTPTVFNILGPLLNPAPLDYQLIGVNDPEILRKLGEVLAARGLREAMIVHGEEGLDELSLAGPTRVAHVKKDAVREYRLTPADFGLNKASNEDLKGGTPTENAVILYNILKGGRGPKRDVVLLNASAALVVAGAARDFREGVRIAAESIDSGKSLGLLERLVVNAEAHALIRAQAGAMS